MNNNSNRGNNSSSNSNNRRRGRGNNNRPQGGGGGGQQLNRVDSRARGNAPQLLEKYRKLAQDAHMNGDRVAAEYYLQFADHYFRVIADQRVRQDEARGRPRDERWQEGDESSDEGEFNVESDFPSFDQPSYTRRERDDRPRPVRPAQEERQDEQDRGDEAPRAERTERAERAERAAPEEREEAADSAAEPASTNPYEPPANPFVRENRGTRGLRPRREDRRPRRDDSDDAPAGLDPASLPPAISISREEPAADEESAVAKPRRGRPRRKPSADDAGETLESVN